MTVNDDEEQGKLISASGSDAASVEKAKEEAASLVEMAQTQSSGLGSPGSKEQQQSTSSSSNPQKYMVHQDSWTPPEAHFEDDTMNDRYPLIKSVVGMRKIKGYVNGDNLMPTTTYSFIVSTNFRPNTVAVNIFVFFLQVFSYAAVVLNTFDFSSTGNPFQFPANVEGGVRASQLLSLICEW